MSRAPGRFGAVATAMVTPFDAGGALDTGAAADLARWLVANGNDALVVTGTTGESGVLTDDERVAMWETVARAVDVPVIAGSTSNDTHHSVELTKAAEGVGVAAILAVTPYYCRPGQAGIEGHMRAVAEATSLPVMLYDIPIRTGRKISHDTLVRLATEVPNIVAVKDAAGDPVAAARLLASTPPDFELYSGDSALTLPLLAIGASGVVGVASHWTGSAQAEMIAAFAKGEIDRARQLNAALLDAYAFEGSDDAPNPLPTKAVLRALGFGVGQCRLPMGDAPEGLDERARQHLAALGPLAASA